MKITSKSNPLPLLDLPIKPTSSSRRKIRKTPKKGGPPTPLIRWKFHEASPETRRRTKAVSSRKLGSSLWRIQVPRNEKQEEERGRRSSSRRREGDGGGDELGFKVCFNSLFDSQDLIFSKPEVGQVGDRLYHHHANRECGSEPKDVLRSPCSVNGPVNGFLWEQTPFQFSNYAMEGATKWDPVCSKASNEPFHDVKIPNQKAYTALLEAQLEEARARIQKLESERHSSKKKLEHFLKKLSQERAVWRSREHEKVRAIIEDVKVDLSRERKNRHRQEIVNSKLVNELAEVKLSAKRYIQDYGKERKARELIEEVCDELAKEIGEDKAEVDTLKRECMKVRDEVEDERKMLQMAEVWREERVQMKLIDAKMALDEKYSYMSQLVFQLEEFLRLKGANLSVKEIRKAQMLKQAAASMNIHDIKEFTYEPSKSDDISALVEEMAMGETYERQIEPCVEYSSANHSKSSIHQLSNVYVNQNGDVDDDVSGWETVSNAEDQDSSYSAEGSTMSAHETCRVSNALGSCTEWEEQASGETPVTDSIDVCSIQSKTVKKVKSITRLWRSCPNNDDNYKVIPVDGINGRLSNGRLSSIGGVESPDCGSGDVEGWSSPDLRKSQMNKGIKGCIEWPRGVSNISLKHKFLEARMQTQKIQIRHVLKQKF